MGLLSSLKGILFDLDDTLFDRRRAQVETCAVFSEMYPTYFRGITRDQISTAFLKADSMSGMDPLATPWGQRVARTRLFLELLGVQAGIASELTRTYVERYPRVNAPIPGAQQTILVLSETHRLAIVSNGLPDVQHTKVGAIGLRKCFTAVVLSGELGVPKPDPAIFCEACSRLGLSPEDCMHVGDSFESDVIGAKGAGIKACWYNPLRLPPPTEVTDADCTVSRMLEILSL